MTQVATPAIAPLSRRAIAYLIDALIAAGIAVVGTVVLVVVAFMPRPVEQLLIVMPIGYGVLLLVLLGWLVVYTWMQAGSGSIGMRAQGLRLVSDDGAPLGFGRALLRNVIFGLAASIVVGYFTPLFDGTGRFQGWHDKVARSLMVDARGPRQGTPAAPATTAMPVAPGTTAMPVVSGASGAPAVPAIPGIPAPGASGASSFAPDASAAPAPAVPAAPPLPSPSAAAQPEAAGPAAATGPVAPAAPVADEGSVIAYVPGVSRPAQPAAPAPAPSAAPAPAAHASEPALDETVVQRPAAAPVAPPIPPSPDVPSAPVPASAPLAPEPAPVVEPAASDDVEDTRISIPGHRLVFTWDDGSRVTVSRRTIFGRNPAPEDGAVLVPVRDETLSLSKTHFEAAADTSGGWVLDRHSTNGMTIVRDGQRIACPAGQRVPVRLGDAIEIGDRIVTIGGYA